LVCRAPKAEISAYRFVSSPPCFIYGARQVHLALENLLQIKAFARPV
jgi:hypothetical protein